MRFFNYTIFTRESSAAPPLPEPPTMSGPDSPGDTLQLPQVNPQAGLKPVPYKVIPLNFANALVEATTGLVKFKGNFIFFILGTSVGGTVPILNIRIGDQQSDPIPFTPGVSLRGFPFDTLYLSNVITGTETGSLLIGYDPNIEELAAT